MWLLRPLPLLALVVTACLVVAGGVALLGGPRGGGGAGNARGPGSSASMEVEAVEAVEVVQPEVLAALDVLRRWDRSRAAAYASGDRAALRRLYVSGAAAGRSDLRMLQAYADRGLAVRGIALQRSEVEVLEATDRLLRVEVVERLGRATVVAGRTETRLPGDRPERRRITLVRGDGRWRVAAAEPVSGGPRRSGR